MPTLLDRSIYATFLIAVILGLACQDGLHTNESIPAAQRRWTDKTAVLSLASASAAPGGTVTLEVSLTGEASPSGLQWSLVYPASDLLFEKSEIASTATSAGKSIQCSDNSGTVTCVLFGLDRETMSDGAVAELSFTIAPATKADSASVTLVGLAATSPEGYAIPTMGSIDPTVVKILSLDPTSKPDP